jgi:tRNA pseudouridine(38-40) synthase
MRAKVVRRRCTITGLHLIQFEFEADRFLYKMVRRMAGALVDIGRGLYSQDDLAQAITDQPRVQFSTAPAHGLLFVRARYSRLSITSASSRSG